MLPGNMDVMRRVVLLIPGGGPSVASFGHPFVSDSIYSSLGVTVGACRSFVIVPSFSVTSLRNLALIQCAQIIRLRLGTFLYGWRTASYGLF